MSYCYSKQQQQDCLPRHLLVSVPFAMAAALEVAEDQSISSAE